MATQKEISLGQLFLAIGRGVGKAHLSDESVAWLFDRYSAWLETKSSKTGKTPLEDWKDHELNFLKKFAEIGEGAAAHAAGPTGLKAEVLSAQTAALAVEKADSSNCPYCPDVPGGTA
jgi:hypothetical protein